MPHTADFQHLGAQVQSQRGREINVAPCERRCVAAARVRDHASVSERGPVKLKGTKMTLIRQLAVSLHRNWQYHGRYQ